MPSILERINAKQREDELTILERITRNLQEQRTTSQAPRESLFKQTALSTPSIVVDKPPATKIGKFFGAVGKFALETGVAVVDLVTEFADFTVNFISRNVLTTPLGIVGPGDRRKLSEQWKNFYDEQLSEGNIPTREAKLVVDQLQANPLIVPSEKWQNAPTKDKFLTPLIGETILQIGPSVTASLGLFPLAGLPLATAIISGATANDVTELAVEHGVDRDLAEPLGLSTGLLVGWLERIVPSRLFTNTGIRNQFIGNFARRLAESSILETGTEIAQENIQLIAEATFRDDLGWDEVATRNAMAGLGGLLGGAGAQTVVSFANQTQRQEILQGLSIGLAIKDVGGEGLQPFIEGSKSLKEEKSRFKTAQDLLREVGRPKHGAQGLNINRAEAKQLIEYLVSLDEAEAKELVVL